MRTDYTMVLSYGDLERQASITAGHYFVRAVRSIDEEFGVGYAKKNPELVAAMMRIASDDFSNSCRLIISQQGYSE